MEKMDQAAHIASKISDNKGPVLVSFYNDTCAEGVCGTQNVYLGKLSNDLRDTSVRFEEVNVDQAPEMVEQFQITTLPTALLFVDGALVTRMSGLTDPGVLACAVLQHIDNGAAVMERSGNICPMPQQAA